MPLQSNASRGMCKAIETGPAQKFCKTCRWSQQLAPTDEHAMTVGNARYECVWLVHHHVPISITCISTFMYEHEGVYCPCWEKKSSVVNPRL